MLLHRSETLALQTSGLSLPPNRFLLSTRCFHAFIDLQAGALRHVLPPVTRSNRPRGRIPWWAFARRVPNWPSLEAHFGHDEVTGSSRLPQSAGLRSRLMDRLSPQGSGRHRCRPPLTNATADTFSGKSKKQALGASRNPRYPYIRMPGTYAPHGTHWIRSAFHTWNANNYASHIYKAAAVSLIQCSRASGFSL